MFFRINVWSTASFFIRMLCVRILMTDDDENILPDSLAFHAITLFDTAQAKTERNFCKFFKPDLLLAKKT